jgi:hypothetical protein
MDPMNVDPLNPMEFGFKYRGDYPNAAIEEATAAYNEYKDFYVTYQRDHPGTATNCYEEFLQTLGKRGKQASNTRLLGG